MHKERLLTSGNQFGKTLAAAAETAMHLTGLYPGAGGLVYPDFAREGLPHPLAGQEVWPDGWPGRRWDRPVKFMAGSESAELTRKGVQRLLLGTPEDESQWGTGFIPQTALVGTTRKSGVSHAVDTITVRHVSGGNSVIQFNSYDQGRGKWQADTVDGVWFDEEPPFDIYMEGLTRTNATDGMVMLTFTPLLGYSDVVNLFLGLPK